MNKRPRKGLYAVVGVLTIALLSSVITIMLMRGGIGNAVVMSAKEYEEYRQFIARYGNVDIL